jgi:hypothetical protein
MSKPTSILTTADITREALKILNEGMSKWDHTYYKVQTVGGLWYIAKGYPSGPSVKGGLTSEEADAYLKLLKEQ